MIIFFFYCRESYTIYFIIICFTNCRLFNAKLVKDILIIDYLG